MVASHLDSESARFLSRALAFALQEGFLSAADVVSEFPPEVIMEALEGNSELRTRVLVETAGVHVRIAPKKSTAAAAEDLRIALDEGVVSPDALLQLLTPDELVRHLDVQAVWALSIRDEYFRKNEARSRARLLDTLEIALDENLLDLPALIRAVGSERLSQELPKPVLERVLTLAIERGLDGSPLDPEALVGSLPLAEWVDHVPLVHLWDEVVLGVVADRAGLTGIVKERAVGVPFDEARARGVNRTKTKRAAAAPPAAGAVTPDKNSAPPPPGSSPAADRSAAEVEARDRAVDNLKRLERLPSNADELPTPLLLAIDAMYAEMAGTGDDDERAECIKDAFPNPAMLKEAMFALAGTLDPRLDRAALESRDASVESLIQLVLFEERRRRSRSLPASSTSPPPSVHEGVAREGSVPPPPLSAVAGRPAAPPNVPLPPPLGGARASVAPPPLPTQARKV